MPGFFLQLPFLKFLKSEVGSQPETYLSGCAHATGETCCFQGEKKIFSHDVVDNPLALNSNLTGVRTWRFGKSIEGFLKMEIKFHNARY